MFKQYDRLVAPQRTITVELTADEQKLILAIHSFGIGAITSEYEPILYSAIAKIKAKIHA